MLLTRLPPIRAVPPPVQRAASSIRLNPFRRPRHVSYRWLQQFGCMAHSLACQSG